MGVVLITLIGWLWFQQKLDTAGIAGIAPVVAGVLVLDLFSKIAVH